MAFIVREWDSPPATPGKCGWCPSRIGEDHADDCVTIKRTNTYEVYINSEYVGDWDTEDPASWSVKDCEFHKNEGSWCSDNAIWFGDGSAMPALLCEAARWEGHGCLCNVTNFHIKALGAEAHRSRVPTDPRE